MRFVAESIIRASPERVFAFHELPDALGRLFAPLMLRRLRKLFPYRHEATRAWCERLV